MISSKQKTGNILVDGLSPGHAGTSYGAGPSGSSLEMGPSQTRERAHSSMTFVPSVGWVTTVHTVPSLPHAIR
jgi:hypothetical protein